RPSLLSALSALGRRLPRPAVQHRLLCAAHAHGRAGDRLQAGRVRAHVRRRPPLSQSPRAGAAAAVAPAAPAAAHAAQSGGDRPVRVPLRGFHARRLRPAPAHQGQGGGVTMDVLLLRDKIAEAGCRYAASLNVDATDDWLVLKTVEEAGELVQSFLRYSARARSRGQNAQELKRALDDEIRTFWDFRSCWQSDSTSIYCRRSSASGIFR